MKRNLVYPVSRKKQVMDITAFIVQYKSDDL